MRIAVLAQSWPGPDGSGLAPRAVASVVEAAWLDAVPGSAIAAVPVGDGGPRSADALAGSRSPVGGVEATEAEGALVLAPAGGAPRWESHALAAGLLGLAAEHADARHPRTVVVPVGDEAPAGDAADLWLGGLAQMRAGLASLDVVAAVSSSRPLLGLRGMSAAVRDRRESDEALAIAAQRQEERWSAIARGADPLAASASLLSTGRLSDQPGSGAAGGLAYCLAAAGARLAPAGPFLASLAGAERAAADAAVILAVVPSLEPRTLDEGAVPAASALAAATGAPCVVLAPRSRIGRRDLMNAGVASAHEAAAGGDGLADGIARIAQTWGPRA
ncbi:glycerate kinase [Demequina sp. NBRC 110056]|uniref:glycerate kinase n=1 Tax=Demequina sp. NBRC 110056 TaxID=1570345 RepID=UPI0009FDD0FC|nr:glycerate kinase [Demequina sp. NBRC 110056]